MPVYEYEGKHFDLPDGLTNEQAIKKIESHLKESQLDGQMAKIGGVGEAALGVGSSLLGGAAQGLRALGEMAFSDADMKTALERSESSADAITYQPRTQTGKNLTKDVMDTLHDYQQEVGNKFAGSLANVNRQKMSNGSLTASDLAGENTERLVGELLGGAYVPGMTVPRSRLPAEPKPSKAKPVDKLDALKQKLETPTEPPVPGAGVFDEMAGQLRNGEHSPVDTHTPDVMGNTAEALTKAAELKQKETQVQAMWQELLAEKNAKKRAAMQADIALAERQLAMEQAVAQRSGLDFNAAERARQEQAPTGYDEHVAGQTGDRAMAATAEGLLDPATAAQRGIRAEGIPETRQGTETLYTDPAAQTFRGNPADPMAVLALERQKEAARNNLQYDIATKRGQPMDALTVDNMRKANEGPQLPWGEEGLQHQFKAELETQAVDSHPFVQAAERRLTKQEELVIKLKEQVKNGRAQASTLAREVKNLEHLEQALEKTRVNVTKGQGEGQRPVPFNFKKQGGGVLVDFGKKKQTTDVSDITRLERQIEEVGRRYTAGELSFEQFSETNHKLIGEKIAAEQLQRKRAESVGAKSVEDVFPGYKTIPKNTYVTAVHGLKYKDPQRAKVVGTHSFRHGEKAYNLPIVDFGDGVGRKLLPSDIKEVHSPRPFNGPGGKQAGAVNPAVFEEGFQKTKQIGEYTMELMGRPWGPEVRIYNKAGEDVGGLSTSVTAGKVSDRNLSADFVKILTPHQKKGLAESAYKFLAETGNDIQKSSTLLPDGKKMWQRFEEKGLSKDGIIPRNSTIKSPGGRQQGALLIDPSKQKQGKFLEDSPALKLPGIVSERLTMDQVKEISKAVPDVEQNLVQKVANAFTKGGLYQALKTDHPIIKYSYDHITEADRMARGDIQTYVHDSLGPATRALKGAERTEIWEAVNLADLLQKEITPEMLRESGFNERQIAYAETHRAVMDKAFEMANKAREAAGMKPISKRTAYAAMKATGDYRQLVYKLEDGERVVAGIVGSDFRPLLKHRADALLKKGYELGEVKYYGGVPKHVGDAQKALGQVLEILAKDDPRVAEFAKVMEDVATNEAYSFLNAKKHTLNKKGIFGMEGRKTEEGTSPLLLRKLAEKNADEGLQSQMTYAETMFKWGRLSEAVDAIKPILSDTSIQAPVAKAWAEKYVQNALGYNPSKMGHYFEQALAEGMGSTGVGYSNLRYTMALARKSVNTVLLALDPVFIATNLVQPMKAMPGMKTYLVSKGLDANFDFGTGWSYLGKAAITDWKYRKGVGSLTEVEKGAFEYAKTHRVYGSDLVEQSNRAKKDAAFKVDKVANFGLSEVESATREVMFLGMVDMLHQNGLSVKNGLYEAAHNLTDMTMNNYSPVERPPIYNSLGPVGDMAVNLSSFKHNEISRIALFARQLAEEKSARPLLAELGSQIAFAGVTGIIAYDAADYLYRFITKKLGKPDSLSLRIIKMSEELGDKANSVTGAKKDGLGDARHVLSHGGFSMLGLDMSKRLGLGHVVGDNAVDIMFPGGSKIGDVVSAGAKAVVDPTEMNVKRFASEVVPRPAATNMEMEWFSKTKPDGDEAAHNKRTLENTVTRNGMDKFAKRVGGTGIHESVEKEKLYQTQAIKQAYADMRVKPLEHARDELFSTGKVSKETVQAYLKAEGDINTLIADINRMAKEQNIPAKDRELLKASMSRSITSLRHAQRLKEVYEDKSK